MPTIRIGLDVLRGIVKDKPLLPKGFRYIEKPGCWLLAVDPGGKTWIVSPTKLYRWKSATWRDVVRTFIRNFGRHCFKIGQNFIDVRESIDLTQIAGMEAVLDKYYG